MGALISDVFRRIKSLFGATLEPQPQPQPKPQPQPQPSIKDDLATESQLGLTANELTVWDGYSLLLEERDKLYYIDISRLPAPKDEIERILKKAILHLSANGCSKEALNTCVCCFILLADFQDTQGLELNEEEVEGLSALQKIVQLSSLVDKDAALSNIALEYSFGKAAKAETDERVTEMKQFFRENNLDFPS